jgi:hypothetical protein
VAEFIKQYGGFQKWDQQEIEDRTKEMAKTAYNNVWKIILPTIPPS